MVKEIKASFAYSLGEKFALEVAFREICALKAGATMMNTRFMGGSEISW
jgi:hypothetical protein